MQNMMHEYSLLQLLMLATPLFKSTLTEKQPSQRTKVTEFISCLTVKDGQRHPGQKDSVMFHTGPQNNKIKTHRLIYNEDIVDHNPGFLTSQQLEVTFMYIFFAVMFKILH